MRKVPFSSVLRVKGGSDFDMWSFLNFKVKITGNKKNEA